MTSDEEQLAFEDLVKRRKKEQQILWARSPRNIRTVIGDLMIRKNYGKPQSAALLEKAWTEAVGKEFANHTCVGELRRGVLHVVVRSSLIVQELNFVKHDILQKLQSNNPDMKVRDVRFRTGSID